MTDPATPTLEPKFTFKRYKTLLRCTLNDATDTTPATTLKLSYPRWASLKSSYALSKCGRVLGGVDYRLKELLREHGLLTDGTYKRTDYRGRAYDSETDRILTAIGRALIDDLPDCPPEEEWPQRSAAAATSPTNVRLSDYQQKVINKWTRHLCPAVPVGSKEVEESRWLSPNGAQGTFAALVRMGLIEPGVSGVSFDEDGNLQAVGQPSLVYRLTVLGALQADSM